ncbi:MAG TPA: inositol monophosphatase family protein [Anaeromyxobacteraceae bacterium]|nr:inositol monophosphatase family protein [Anaeromyxobacteraceae bacterium]
MPGVDLEKAMATARRAVEAAAAAELHHFRRGVRVEVKPDRTPVTAADREGEAAILAVVREAFPDHAFLGEETGAHAGAAASRWIVDPLDGTKGFTRGRGFWGPLVALEHEGEIVAGAMALPALGETYWAARGLGAWMQAGGGQALRLAVSGVAEWEDATLSLGEPHVLLVPPLLARVARLATSCASSRCYGDLAGCALVLQGKAEAWVEAGVKVWDIAPLKILVEEAGGRFTDLAGRATVESGGCIASNGLVHGRVLAALRGPGARTRSRPRPRPARRRERRRR